MGGTEPRAALADAAGRLDDDSLAREIIRALDAVRSAELTIRVLRVRRKGRLRAAFLAPATIMPLA